MRVNHTRFPIPPCVAEVPVSSPVGGVAPDELAECVTGVFGGEYRKVLWDSNGALRYDVDKVRRILNEIPPPPEEDLEGQFRDEVKAAHECLMEHAHFYRPA